MRVHREKDHYISRRISEEGVWEPYETSLLLSFLGPGAVFVDVGANIGYFSVIAARLVGASGAVFAFEPGRDNFALLRDNLELNDCRHTVTAVEAGLALAPGRGRLYLSADNAGDHQIFAVDAARNHHAIELLNGSDYLRGRVPRMDLLKVDVQGAEYAVIAGLLPLLRELPRPPRIMIELTPLSLRQAGSSGRELVELLATLGQPLYIIDHIEHRLVACPAAELAQWCDAVDAVAGDAGFMNILLGAPP
jgi:FkbM family methyltransferase